MARIPRAILAASVPETPPPMMRTLRRGRAGDAAEEDARPARRALQVVGGGLHGHPARDLAHRREQRQLAVGGLHGLVRDRVDAPLEQELGEPAVGGEVQVGEQLLAVAEAVVLRRAPAP